MKASIVKDDCIACGLCEEICPEVFVQGDEVAEVIVDTVPADAEDCAREAADSCPTDAIIIEE